MFFAARGDTPLKNKGRGDSRALSEKFGRGATFERDFSFGFNSSEKTEGTLPEELDRAEAIPRGARCQSARKTDFSQFSKNISRTIDRAIAPPPQS